MILAKDVVARALRLINVMEDYDPSPATIDIAPADIIDRALRSIDVSERYESSPVQQTISVNRVLTRTLRLLSVTQAGESLEAAQVEDSLTSLNASYPKRLDLLHRPAMRHLLAKISTAYLN